MPAATSRANPRNLPALRTPPRARPGWRVLPRRGSASWLPVAIGCLLGANLVLYVVTVIQEAGLNRIQADIYSARQENVRLRAELASYESPDRVEERATSELKLTHGIAPWMMPGLPAQSPAHAKVQPPAFGVPEAY